MLTALMMEKVIKRIVNGIIKEKVMIIRLRDRLIKMI